MTELLTHAFQIGSLVFLFYILRTLEKIAANQEKHIDLVLKMRSPQEIHRCVYGQEP
jgi:hypothetical protein